MKAIIFDSGSLINLSMNGLLYLLEPLKSHLNGKFLLTNKVKYEVIDRPIKIPRFQLGALRLKTLIKNEVLETPEALKIKPNQLQNLTQELKENANHLIKLKNKFINIVSDAEMSCLALSTLLTRKQIPNIIAVDERTTRILAEKPENLETLMSRKLKAQAELTTKDFEQFENFKFIRSSELVYVAHKLNLLKVKGPQALEAALYATKYKGSSISHDEIKVLKKL